VRFLSEMFAICDAKIRKVREAGRAGLVGAILT